MEHLPSAANVPQYSLTASAWSSANVSRPRTGILRIPMSAQFIPRLPLDDFQDGRCADAAESAGAPQVTLRKCTPRCRKGYPTNKEGGNGHRTKIQTSTISLSEVPLEGCARAALNWQSMLPGVSKSALESASCGIQPEAWAPSAASRAHL